ncbi:hypothetical protein [Desulfoluna butyratoxydans]|uniref:hypothetical protein n=1 Tax=Desulfoluna butyratoxydans TaxID=231438 RepID=UPI0015D12842|nr:hypothetical protein [Desulfoluna butyratoxydans]
MTHEGLGESGMTQRRGSERKEKTGAVMVRPTQMDIVYQSEHRWATPFMPMGRANVFKNPVASGGSLFEKSSAKTFR